VALVAVLVSLSSFLLLLSTERPSAVWRRGRAYHIARRVVDSQTPGLLQLGRSGCPCLNLPDDPVPFLGRDVAERAGGRFPSMMLTVLGVVGIFRLVGRMVETSLYTKQDTKPARKRRLAWEHGSPR